MAAEGGGLGSAFLVFAELRKDIEGLVFVKIQHIDPYLSCRELFEAMKDF